MSIWIAGIIVALGGFGAPSATLAADINIPIITGGPVERMAVISQVMVSRYHALQTTGVLRVVDEFGFDDFAIDRLPDQATLDDQRALIFQCLRDACGNRRAVEKKNVIAVAGGALPAPRGTNLEGRVKLNKSWQGQLASWARNKADIQLYLHPSSRCLAGIGHLHADDLLLGPDQQSSNIEIGPRLVERRLPDNLIAGMGCGRAMFGGDSRFASFFNGSAGFPKSLAKEVQRKSADNGHRDSSDGRDRRRDVRSGPSLLALWLFPIGCVGCLLPMVGWIYWSLNMSETRGRKIQPLGIYMAGFLVTLCLGIGAFLTLFVWLDPFGPIPH